ncbi:MAG: hypothetical protein IPO27_06450 [Bacteroidetes bacterium]|nr:hypothetical protein [Bacteroidota bacterium]
MNKIENLMQLQLEISRLKGVAKDQEKQLKKDLLEIKEDLKPANIIMNGISSFTGIKLNNKDFLKEGFAYGISLLLQRFVLKTERKVEDKIYHLVDSVFERLQSFLQKHTHAEAKRKEREDI